MKKEKHTLMKYIIVLVVIVFVLCLISWLLNRTFITDFFNIDLPIVPDYISAIILLFTAYIIIDYTKATKQMVEKNTEMIISNNRQTEIIAKQYNFKLLPSISHNFYLDRNVDDMMSFRLVISNNCSFEVYTKVFVDIYYKEKKIELPQNYDKLAYQGKTIWATEPNNPYEGHFEFGRWLLEGYKDWESCYPFDETIKNHDYSNFNELYEKYQDCEIKFELRFRSASAFKLQYFSNTYTYIFRFTSEFNEAPLIPQVTNLIVYNMFDENGRLKEEYNFPPIPNCEIT